MRLNDMLLHCMPYHFTRRFVLPCIDKYVCSLNCMPCVYILLSGAVVLTCGSGRCWGNRHGICQRLLVVQLRDPNRGRKQSSADRAKQSLLFSVSFQMLPASEAQHAIQRGSPATHTNINIAIASQLDGKPPTCVARVAKVNAR